MLNTVVNNVAPWKGWADTHADFSRVDEIPAIIWRNSPNGLGTALELSRWLAVLCAFTFFAFFGFAEEARKNYYSAAQSIAKRVGISSTSSFGSTLFGSSGTKSGMASSGGGATLPVFIHNHTIRKVDDLDSISDMSVSTRDASAINEKPFNPDLSFGALSLSDVGGTLADYKPDPYSPTPSSGASSASLSPPHQPSPTTEMSSGQRLDV
jgi:pheromone a factor receptor